MNQLTNEIPSYSLNHMKNVSKSPKNRCKGKALDSSLYKSPYHRLSRNRNSSNPDTESIVRNFVLKV